MRHFLEVDDLSPDELMRVLDLAVVENPAQVLSGQGAALVFMKPSLRTRNSMERAVQQLGGHPVAIGADEVGIDTRETAEDVALTLSQFHSIVAARVFEHRVLERMAAVATVPIVNLLSDAAHPMQALADLLTIRNHFGKLEGLTVAYIGDGNNVCRSLMVAAGMAGMIGRVATPPGYDLGEAEMDHLRGLGMAIDATHVAREAVDGADIVYTDVWTSMGQEAESEQRFRDFEHFTIDSQLMSAARPEAVLMHCLPAHRGEEIAADVLEGPQSLVWPQAQNRMHAARGLLLFLLGQQ
ncbi:MAG: ornithine carbamoyltransferase [Acidimicrobiales bacterium]